MRANRFRSDALMSAPRVIVMAIVLFAVGTGFGLLGALVLPMAAARGEKATQSVAAPPVAAAARGGEAAETSCRRAPLRRRAAQVLVVGMPDVTYAADPLVTELTRLGVGGVFINDGNVVDSIQILALTDALRDAADIPLLITTDEESGRVSSFRGLIGATSSPRTLANSRSAEDVRTYAAEMAGQLAELGINSDLAPVADLDGGPSYGVIGDRAFSADPLVAAEYAEAFAAGLADAGLVPVVKHFPGHGRSLDDVHKRRSAIDTPLEELLATDVLPFVALIEAGVPIVMVGHPTYTAVDPEWPASMSPAMYRLLRDLGFNGVAMTDSIGMGAIHRRWKFPQASVLSLRAGADAVLATDGRHAAAMVDAIVAAVRSGKLPEPRLDEAVARVLAMKGLDPRLLTCADAAPVPSMARDAAVTRR